MKLSKHATASEKVYIVLVISVSLGGTMISTAHGPFSDLEATSFVSSQMEKNNDIRCQKLYLRDRNGSLQDFGCRHLRP